MSIPPFPSFYLIGAERSGVRWLRYNLDRHPDICAPPVDLHYYARADLMLGKGSRWYRQQFDSWRGEAWLGEASPGYLVWRNSPWDVAVRLHQAAPDARLIAILRSPLERMQSATAQAIVRGDLPPQPEWEAIAPEDLTQFIVEMVRGGVYTPILAHFRDHFGDQLKIMLYDDLVADPADFYRQALRHLGAPDTFVPDDIERVRFRGPAVELEPLTHDQRLFFYENLRENINELAGWLGRDLSSWDPAVADR